jgi:membrane protein
MPNGTRIMDAPDLPQTAPAPSTEPSPVNPPAPPQAARARLSDFWPKGVTWANWKRVIVRTGREVITDRVSLASAGCAFYATLALFPAISMIVSIYGLVFDPATVEPQLSHLRDLLPPSAYTLIADRIHMLVTKPPGTLTFSLGISIAVALWSATTGTKSILGALNLAYDTPERRSFLRFQLTAFTMTICGIVAVAIGIALLVLVPVVESFLGISEGAALLSRLASLGVLVVFVVLSLSLVYRFGASRPAPDWAWVAPGTVLATLLWLAASTLFSYYVGHLATYDATYGPLGAVVGVMMWFFVSAFVALVGAELNAELEAEMKKASASF